jgi:diguanylate cyclase (GGDEF)-like protein/putative nucleotidyltransferase with HDIG domain
MGELREDLKGYSATAIAVLCLLTGIGSILLLSSLTVLWTATAQSLLILLLLSFILAATSAKHPLKFLGNGTAVSVSETLTFLGVVLLGPHYGVILAALDSFLISRRFRVRPSLRLFNFANQTISIYFAGLTYSGLRQYLDAALWADSGLNVFAFALPLVALATTDYILQSAGVAVMSRVSHIGSSWDRLRDTFPWEPLSFLVGAVAAGMIGHTLTQYGIVTTAGIMLLAVPFLATVYYTFKVYRDKVGEKEEHYREVTEIYDSILQMLAMAIDAKDDVTHDHIQRVRLFACRIGELVGLSELEIEALKAGALLHDIGKIGVPAYILNKPGKLTQHEFEQMKMHTVIGADMLSNIDFRYPVVPIVRHHHERWDGRGYPDGLKGEQIPVTARILTLVDNYDALRSDRPYKKGMSREEALAYIRENAGSFFDPMLVNKFLSVADRLEAEAESIKASPAQTQSPLKRVTMASAAPAAGYESTPEVDRATAALQSIAEANQRVAALYDISRTLSNIISVEDTLAILGSRLSKLLPFTTCAISLFDRSRSEFEVVHAVGRHAERFVHRRLSAEAGITGYVITNQRPIYNTKPVLDLGFLGPEEAGEYKGVVVFPLVKNDESLGAIALYSTEIETYGAEYIQLVEAVSHPAADAIYNALTFERAQRDALTDSATGLANIKVLSAQFERDHARSQRSGAPLSVIVVRINNLDQAARISGTTNNQLLASIGALITEQVRETDVVARFSGSAFAVLMPDSGRRETPLVCNRLREALQTSNPLYRILASFGWAVSPDHGDSLGDLLQAADIGSMVDQDAMNQLDLTDATDEVPISSV